MATAIYFLSRSGKKLIKLYRKDLTIAVSIGRQNCDRLYSQIEPLDLLSKGVRNGTVAQFIERSILDRAIG